MEVKAWFCMWMFLHFIPLATSYSGKLLYSTYNAIMEFDIDTGNVTVLVELKSSGGVYAMDYDYKHRFIYFPRFNAHDIVRFAYPSNNITLQTVVQSLSAPSGIAVDSGTGHIYWIDARTDILSRCNLDGSNVTVLSTFNNPWVIRLDVINRWMYVVEIRVGILKYRFDLSEQQLIVNFTSDFAECMAIDLQEKRLYWINYDGDMKSAKDDGSDVKTIISTHVRRNYLAIGVVGSYIYYANENNQWLMMNKTSGSTPIVLYNVSSWIHSIFVFNHSEANDTRGTFKVINRK